MALDSDGVKNGLHERLGACELLGAVTDAEDQDLVVDVELALGEVSDDAQD